MIAIARILVALDAEGGNRTRAARRLGIGHRWLCMRLEQARAEGVPVPPAPTRGRPRREPAP